jgi:hypothetical protein
MARSTCIYGITGTRKTTAVKLLAHYIAESTGKCTLLLSTDGGGWEPCEPEIQAGMIRPYRVETATIPLSILRNISKGYWPADPNETRPERINLVPVNWNEVGGVSIEGWTSISQVVMRYLPDAGISVGGEDRNKLGGFAQEMYVGGQMTKSDFRSNTRGDYGFVQNFLYGLVTNFNSLPARDILHTALESKTEDDDRSTVFGPAIAGKKATAQCGAWVGNLIHAQDYSVPRKVQVPNPSDPGKFMEQDLIDMTVRFYFKKHPDPATGILFPAKPRVTPEKMADLDKRFPGGYFEPTADGANGFDSYLRTLDDLALGSADSLKGWRERADQKLGRTERNRLTEKVSALK